MNLYSVYDLKALSYGIPFPATNDSLAMRMCFDAMADSGTVFSAHPEDFVLYCVGSFDCSSGEILPLTPRRHVTDFTSLIGHEKPAAT